MRLWNGYPPPDQEWGMDLSIVLRLGTSMDSFKLIFPLAFRARNPFAEIHRYHGCIPK
jgi:hypothetical protein